MNYEQKYKKALEAVKFLQEVNPCDREYVFRPLAGDTIEKAAEKAVELDGKVVLAFNGAYIPVDNKTKDKIVAEYHDWVKKQGEQHSPVDIDKMVDEFAHTEVEGYGIPSMIEVDAYRRGIEDALEKQGEPEDKESDDELTWLKTFIEEEAYYLSMDIRDEIDRKKLINLQNALAWLEKQGHMLDPDKVIEWLRKNTCAACWDKPDEGISQRIEQFKKDFGL